MGRGGQVGGRWTEAVRIPLVRLSTRGRREKGGFGQGAAKPIVDG